MNELEKMLSWYLGTKLKVLIGNQHLIDWAYEDASWIRKGKDWKPLMLPLSAISEPIKVEGYNNGEEFVPIEHIKKLFSNTPNLDYLYNHDHVWEHWIGRGFVKTNVEFCVIEELIKMGFWIGSQDLFDQGLIIDKRTV